MINCLTIVGRLTDDPDLQDLGKTKVCRFTIAVNPPKYRNSKEEPLFMPCNAWGAQGGICNKYLHKGSLVAITGRLSQRSYKDKNGVSRRPTCIMVENIEFLNSRASDEDLQDNSLPIPTETATEPQEEVREIKQKKEEHSFIINDEDLPF